MIKKDHKLKLAGIVRESIVDGPGIRFTIFAQGCPHNCKGCHNPETHDFAGGRLYSIDRLEQEIRKNPLLSGVTFSGGEPFCQAEAFAHLAVKVKKMGLTVAVYSGYTYEEIRFMGGKEPEIRSLLYLADYLIDGPYIESQRDLTLPFRGSSNQRVIDLNKSREAGEIVLWQEE